MKTWTVYRIKTPSGDYIGVTSRNPRQRFNEVRSRRKLADAELEIIGTFESEALALLREKELRPIWDCELNIAPGGGAFPKRPGEYRGEKRISVMGKEYDSLHAAARDLGLNPSTIQYRLASAYFEDWFYLSASKSKHVQTMQSHQRRQPAKAIAWRSRRSFRGVP